MAGVGDYFAIGSVVSCRTCQDQTIEGQVQAFDEQTKMLILKCAASNGRPSCNDVFVVNLSLVSDVQVKKDVSTQPESPVALNFVRLNSRLRSTVDQKKRLISALQAGVTPEGQKLFSTISKTIDEVSWRGPDIVILNQVTITPPYRPENVKGDIHSKAFIHIRKVVEKHIHDTSMSQSNPSDGDKSSPPSGASSPVTAMGSSQ